MVTTGVVDFSGAEHAAIRATRDRLAGSAAESDLAYFYDLMVVGELALKLATAAALAAVGDDLDRTRYGFEYRLLRADGLGDWGAVLTEVLTGPANALLRADARPLIAEVTRTFAVRDSEDEWQISAVRLLDEASHAVDGELEGLSDRVSLRWWFSAFSRLRNRTRGHGAITAAKASLAAPPLAESINILASRLGLLKIPWMHLHQNINGRYRVTPLGGDCSPYDYLKSEADHRLASGSVFVGVGPDLCASPLVAGDAGTRTLFVANGAYQSKNGTAEFLDYATDERRRVSREAWSVPPDRLPPSETHGQPELEVVGNTFANIPPRLPGYIARRELEQQVSDLLEDDRHPIITLVGLGGVGKTSLAIEVLHRIAESGSYFAVVWFSARDMDLLPQGPKAVRADILTTEDVAVAYTNLMQPAQEKKTRRSALDAWTQALAARDDGMPKLFVFDNFETVADPTELYSYLDHYIRLPNKVLITTRMRDFKADYPVEVRGMTRAQFDTLVSATAVSLGIERLLSRDYLDSLFEEADGHPYMTKVLLGEVARTGRATKVERILGKQEDALRALFERTYGLLSPAGQRVFLTMCSWKSLVPALALEAALLRPRNERLDVQAAIDELRRSSLIELVESEDGTTFVRVPLSAYLFGQAKLRVSPIKAAVELDAELLRRLGPTQPSEVNRGLAPRAHRLIRALAEDRSSGRDTADDEGVLRYMALSYPPLLLEMADMYLEGPEPDLEAAKECVSAFLQHEGADPTGWRKLVVIARISNDPELELHARLQLAELPAADYLDVSDAASAFARLRGALEVERDVRRAHEEKLIRLMEARIDEALPLDLSRLAWLYLYQGKPSKAAEVVRRGLAAEPTNTYLLRLSQSPHLEGLM